MRTTIIPQRFRHDFCTAEQQDPYKCREAGDVLKILVFASNAKYWYLQVMQNIGICKVEDICK